ncbi:MAG: hypothetical protein KDA61_03060, partial [Planctomycetales bacterium]|nr:hypothetical protein [Planctomycetales bacterium]
MCPKPANLDAATLCRVLVGRSTAFGLAVLVWACPATVSACRYNVRDVAFVVLNDRPYELSIAWRDSAGAISTAKFIDIASEVLTDSNVVADFGGGRDVGPLTPIDASQPSTFGDPHDTAALTLTSPDARTLSLPLPNAVVDDDRLLRQAIARVVHSPLRSQLTARLPDSYALVLVVECSDERLNQRAMSMADNAIARIVATMPELPKSAGGPPRAIVVPAELLDEERVLLWSLSIDVRPQRDAQIVMLFGRGRRLGPVLNVSNSTDDDVLRSLAVAGLDCECELDRSWMQTAMIPHFWSRADEQRAADILQFDPGHALVKVEISRILSRGPDSRGVVQSDANVRAVEAMLPGLQIVDLDAFD